VTITNDNTYIKSSIVPNTHHELYIFIKNYLKNGGFTNRFNLYTEQLNTETDKVEFIKILKLSADHIEPINNFYIHKDIVDVFAFENADDSLCEFGLTATTYKELYEFLEKKFNNESINLYDSSKNLLSKNNTSISSDMKKSFGQNGLYIYIA